MMCMPATTSEEHRHCCAQDGEGSRSTPFEATVTRCEGVARKLFCSVLDHESFRQPEHD